MENWYLLIAFVLTSVVLLIMLLAVRLENINLRFELAKAEIDIRFFKEIITIRDWRINSLEIYAALFKNNFSKSFISSSGFQERLLREFELFEKVRLFNPEIGLDEETIKSREVYMMMMIPKDNLPS